MDSKKCQIFIAKLSHGISEGELEKIFRRCGEIKEIKLKKSFAFIVSIFFE